MKRAANPEEFCIAEFRTAARNRKRARDWYHTHVDLRREYMANYKRNWCKDNPEHYAATVKRYWLRLRKRVIAGYGGLCKCCGEADARFLTLDHVNNDGKKHRQSVSSTRQLYLWVIRNKFPKDLQLLCFNCNMGKSIYGACPHTLKGQS